MQPSTLSKPVMDVAAPKGPTPAPSQGSQPVATAPKPAPSELPVQPAPFFQSAQQQPAANPKQATPAPVSQKPQKATPALVYKQRTPVALITVTIFVMLVLSALAIAVFITSQTA